MKTNLRRVDRIFEAAEKDGRSFLLEPEVYDLLRLAGIVPPRFLFAAAGAKVTRAQLSALGADEVAVKVVSPLIQHKSDVGGVDFVKADAAAVNRACARMLRTVPLRYLRWEAGTRQAGAGPGPSLASVRASIRGFLVMEKVRFENVGFGSEILLGVRNTREFGPVLTMGGGGLDVEYMNARLKEGRAVLMSSAHLVADGAVPGLLEPLAFFGKLAAEFRGRRPLVAPRALAGTFLRFRDLAAAYSPFAGGSPFVIEEAEVNPFVVASGRLVPLDGVCRFSRDKRAAGSRAVEDIRRLLRPATIGIIGVSEKMNIGHLILSNVLKNGFPREGVFVVKPGPAEIDGCRCVPSVADLPETVDLFVLTLGADQCAPVMKDLVDHGKARSVIIIAGGMGEKSGGASIEDEIRGILARGRAEGRTTPIVNGGNCLGIASAPGRYDTTFIPDYKLPRPKGPASGLAVVSQSGAFMICRMSKLPMIRPVYAVSFGNQLDLTASDYMNCLKDDPDVRSVAVYMEGFKPGDGLAFAGAVREMAASGRKVLVYKAGRSPEGRAATSSHTASVAGDYPVFRSVLEQAGAVVAADLFDFETYMKALVFFEGKKVRGRRAGLISNAGFECVVLADNLKDGAGLELAAFTPETQGRIVAALRPLGIDRLQDVHNPLDVTPVADDTVFSDCARAVVEDPGVDCAVISNVPLTAAQQTLAAGEGHGEDFLRPGAFARRTVELFRSTDKPFVVCIDAGELYTPLAAHLESEGVPVFRRADEAVRFLRSYVGHELRAAK
ncbi:MAG TPA: acetate--CoA ligase family protein [Terriglobales bacterium]|nr:acetate--CoA ligase family protein [Terriglobales bacterium]